MSDALKELYRQTALPVFQNRKYDSVAAGRDCPKGDVPLVEDLRTGLVRNAEYDFGLMDFDEAYQCQLGKKPLHPIAYGLGRSSGAEAYGPSRPHCIRLREGQRAFRTRSLV